MQSLAEDDFRLETPLELKANKPSGSSPPSSWTSLVLGHADWAASAGFVLSMMFLAATAIYGLSLSDEAKPYFAEAAAIADGAAYDAGFRLEDLALSGVENTPQSAVFEALKLPYKGSSLSYDAVQAHDDLLKLGWIEKAAVRRFLPSRLEVSVTERVPFARWEDASHKIHVIDSDGHVLGAGGEKRFATLPLFAGDGAPELAFLFEDALEDHGAIRGRIERAELIAERFWTVKLEAGLVVKLPRKVTSLALVRLDSLLANPKIAEMGLETIDLRLSNRTILQLRDASETNRDRAIAYLSSDGIQSVPAMRKGKAL